MLWAIKYSSNGIIKIDAFIFTDKLISGRVSKKARIKVFRLTILAYFKNAFVFLSLMKQTWALDLDPKLYYIPFGLNPRITAGIFEITEKKDKYRKGLLKPFNENIWYSIVIKQQKYFETVQSFET